MRNSALQDMAKLAKERIKSGYWQEVRKNKLAVIEEHKQIDTEFYKKVVSIIESNEIVLNPLAKLMDNDYYNSLSDDAKSRYVLDLAHKYNEMCTIYRKSHKDASNCC